MQPCLLVGVDTDGRRQMSSQISVTRDQLVHRCGLALVACVGTIATGGVDL